MPFLLGLLAVLGALGVFLWRLHMASEAARGLVDAADDVRGFLRRRKWRNKLASDALQLVDDPRIAAAAMMTALAQSDGAVTSSEQSAIVNEMIETFGIDPKRADELFAHARWVVREVADLDTCFRRLAPVIEKTCGPNEKEQLIEMLETVVKAGASLGEAERMALDRLKRVLRHQA